MINKQAPDRPLKSQRLLANIDEHVDFKVSQTLKKGLKPPPRRTDSCYQGGDTD